MKQQQKEMKQQQKEHGNTTPKSPCALWASKQRNKRGYKKREKGESNKRFETKKKQKICDTKTRCRQIPQNLPMTHSKKEWHERRTIFSKKGASDPKSKEYWIFTTSNES